MTTEPKTELNRLFGLYKAEWLNGQLFELFTEPKYFPDLRSHKPCALIGGRGTGKTTVLRGLSYEGQLAFNKKDYSSIPTWASYGIYYRVNTNRVTAFQGPELTVDRWGRYFAHYINLLLCGKLASFLEWYSLHTKRPVELSAASIGRVASSLHLPAVTTLSGLAEGIKASIISFEASINSIADDNPVTLSLQGQPLDVFTGELINTTEFKGKTFSFLIDEYENFLDFQQRVVNTIVKHCGGAYTIKIGVKDLGWRTRDTLNDNERLHHPADYQRIHIGEELEETFSEFAKRVCDSRLLKAGVALGIEDFFPRLTEEEEAEKLRVREVLGDLGSLLEGAEASELEFARSLPVLEVFSMAAFANAQRIKPVDVLRSAMSDRRKWLERYSNYRHAFLFTIRRGKVGIRKYYTGWDVMCKLSGGNIRYLLELVHQSFSDHFELGLDHRSSIVPDVQTAAAEKVGKKNLTELEGVSVEGARLTKLLLSLGRVFQVMAADPVGHTPEVNQFALTSSGNSPADAAVDSLLRAAVMHLAVVRQAGSKLADDSDTREYDYMLHPIFAPFFVYSYRRKRKMKLTAQQVLDLVQHPAETIKAVLESTGRRQPDFSPLPDQLQLFQGFFHAGS